MRRARSARLPASAFASPTTACTSAARQPAAAFRSARRSRNRSRRQWPNYPAEPASGARRDKPCSVIQRRGKNSQDFDFALGNATGLQLAPAFGMNDSHVGDSRDRIRSGSQPGHSVSTAHRLSCPPVQRTLLYIYRRHSQRRSTTHADARLIPIKAGRPSTR